MTTVSRRRGSNRVTASAAPPAGDSDSALFKTPSLPLSVSIYLACCAQYELHPHPNVLVCLRYQLATLHLHPHPINPSSNHHFSDVDLLPIGELLQHEQVISNSLLSHLTTLDLSGCTAITDQGIAVLAHALSNNRHVTRINLRKTRVGDQGTKVAPGIII